MTSTEDSSSEAAVIKHDFNRTFLCIEYPGIVKDKENMLKTLGGIQNISSVYSQKKRRLELRFRPGDRYCKPACGDREKTSALLLKFVVRRRKCHKKEDEQDKLRDDRTDENLQQQGPIVSCTVAVLGQIKTTFKFRNLCDFQYLPMDRPLGNDGPMENIYDKLVPSGLPPSSWLSEDSPYFLPPAAFSRMDTMQSYLYRKEANDTVTPHNIIGRTRQRRSGYGIFVTFDIDKVPKKPREVALKYLQLKFLTGTHYSKITEYFRERPIWSKSALMYLTKFTSDQMKYLLPACAYYFVTGPWRVMWVRFGYDPRQDPSSRKYQTLDYRLRTIGGLKTKVKAKRNYCNYLLPYKSTPSCRPRVATVTKGLPSLKENQKKLNGKTLNENVYIFRPGMIPPSRQLFYQYCDVQVPEIQAMLDKLPEPAAGAKCHERAGWMPKGMDDQCREIINKIVTETLRKEVFSKDTVLEGDGTGTVNEDQVLGEEGDETEDE